MKHALILPAFILAACAPVSPDTAGQVHEITDNMVVIRGVADFTTGQPAAPTPAMVAQAREVCPGAQYLSAVPSNFHEYDDAFLYRFRCS